ncbi:MAG TPA: DUF2948 domain-containing protein [Parvularcula sp.]|nr:DUF2948 domain-containing protein [Parvularcula sp.]HBS32125.1 DUF2948 domain-containing protein [Parvularcula sp.]HBS36822.1 DUF2948 domain-containing protein [Parvularcula sp.]
MTGLEAYQPLRLVAEDADDLNALSAVLQDAIVKIGDFAHLPRQRRFAFVANRFLWEATGERTRGPFARVRTGCHFDDVKAVRQSNLRQHARDAVVEILALRFAPGEDGSGAVTIDLAGGGAIRLDVESVNAQLSDISAPWMTRMKPEHEA